MKIASHHIKGTKAHALSEALRPNPKYRPKKPWPEDCTVQWGHGIIPRTPFFEAFLPNNFIRGEGATIEKAEAKAFAQYERELSCNHQWGRQRPGRDLYNNGAGWCRRCGAFRSKMFTPIVILGHHRKPLSRMEEILLNDMENDHEMNAHMDRTYPEDRESTRKYLRLLQLRRHLFGTDTTRKEEA